MVEDLPTKLKALSSNPSATKNKSALELMDEVSWMCVLLRSSRHTNGGYSMKVMKIAMFWQFEKERPLNNAGCCRKVK
jgi:hypothetical protein